MFWLNQISVKVCAFIYIFKDFHGCTDDVDINIKKKASALMYLTFILDLFKRKLEQKTTFFGGKKKLTQVRNSRQIQRLILTLS